jgi:DNA-directed RNA polymerase specialized sigma24 family protein
VESAGSVDGFSDWADSVQDRLRYALVAAFGPERGLEATNVALTYAWEHWERVASLENPAGYVYKVGRRSATRTSVAAPTIFPSAPIELPWVEPGLPKALGSLTERQRVVVTLVHGFGFSQREVADLLSVSAGSVQRHVERGLKKLRAALGVQIDA